MTDSLDPFAGLEDDEDEDWLPSHLPDPGAAASRDKLRPPVSLEREKKKDLRDEQTPSEKEEEAGSVEAGRVIPTAPIGEPSREYESESAEADAVKAASLPDDPAAVVGLSLEEIAEIVEIEEAPQLADPEEESKEDAEVKGGPSTIPYPPPAGAARAIPLEQVPGAGAAEVREDKGGVGPPAAVDEVLAGSATRKEGSEFTEEIVRDEILVANTYQPTAPGLTGLRLAGGLTEEVEGANAELEGAGGEEEDGAKAVYRMEKTGDLHLDKHLRASASVDHEEEAADGEKFGGIVDAQEQERHHLHLRQEAPWELDSDQHRGDSMVSRWWIFAGVVAAVLIAGLTFMMMNFMRSESADPLWGNDPLKPVSLDSPKSVPFDQSGRVTPEEHEWALFAQEATRVMKLYCSAETIEDRAQYVVPREGVLERMKAFYARHSLAHDQPSDIVDTMLSSRGPVRLAYITDTKNGAADEFHHYPMVQMENGEVRLDFEAASCHNSPTFAELVASKEQKSSVHYMRVVGISDDYYNFAYSDRSRFRCFRLSEAGQTEQVWGYLRREYELSDAGKEVLDKVKENKRRRFSTTVKLRKGPDFQLTRQVLIEKIISKDWYYDLDESK